jgi:UrcA family protein
MIRNDILIAAVALLVASAGHAAERPSITLNISDLDLASPTDVQKLYIRVQVAANELCGLPPLATFLPAPSLEFVACRDGVTDDALSRLHVPLVSALRERIKSHSETR